MKNKTYTDTLYIKYIASGAKNVKEISERIISFANELKEIEKLGCKLVETDGVWIHFEIPDSKAKEYCKIVGLKYQDLVQMNEDTEN